MPEDTHIGLVRPKTIELLGDRRPQRRRWLVIAVLFAACLGISLLQTRTFQGQRLTLNAFEDALNAGEVANVTISPDALTGEFTAAGATAHAPSAKSKAFYLTLPSGLGADWQFVNWVLQNRHQAQVEGTTTAESVESSAVRFLPWIVGICVLLYALHRQTKLHQARLQKPLRVTIVDKEAQ